MKFLLFFCVIIVHSQVIQTLNKDQDSISFRGLEVVSENEFWLAGSKGTIGYTKDGGKSFKWNFYIEYAKNEFRDIVSTADGSIYAMAITQPANIIKIGKNPKNYDVVYSDTNEKAFIDAISCFGNECLVIGDAVQPNQFYLVGNKGSNWKLKSPPFSTKEGEAYFAASGGNIQMLNETDYLVVSGGKVSRLFYSYKGVEAIQELNILQGKETTGANAIAYDMEQEMGVVIGGDFMQAEESMFNTCIIKWDKKNNTFEFTFPIIPPEGYQSSVAYLGQNRWVCCGLNGVYVSQDNGLKWYKVSSKKFHVVRKVNSKKALLAGPKGIVAELIW